jgi:histidine triad (HIT) family protein
MEETIFDKIIAGETQADIVFRNEDVVAFRDINPQAPVHVLVVPRHRMRSIAESPEQESSMLGRLMQGIALTARELGLEENGYRVVFNTGRDALQSVEYIHAHILAGRTLGWPPG